MRPYADSPFPATLQDADFRLVDVNDAYIAYTGWPREKLIGLDPLALQPPEDRAASLRARADMRAGRDTSATRMIERRLIDAGGRERWFRASRRLLGGTGAQAHYLIVLQDTTDEHVARERAEFSRRELDQWFDLSPVGMVLYEDGGLLLRSNAAFAALVGTPPDSLVDAPQALRMLLGFGPGGVASGTTARRDAVIAGPDGLMRPLRATLRSQAGAGGRVRCMAMVEDRSADDERELARIQMGALMDTAGVGVATFRDSGWMHQRGGIGESAPATLQTIGRELVEAASLPAYENLQRALRAGERAEVRYAIRHPELGARWLLTRAEPATLGSGQRTMSIVTLDITELERARLRSEQLLGELSTILESTTTGIASLRGSRVVRCNARFEAMLGLAPGSVAGRDLDDLFGGDSRARRIAAETLRSLADGAPYGETEFELPAPGGDGSMWYSLALRRSVGEAAGSIDAIAVLSDITRLKAQAHDLEALAHDREVQAERTRAILDSVLVGIVIVGADGIRWMNRSARRMFGGDLIDFVHQPIAAVAPPGDADHPFERTHYLEALAEGQAETFECRLQARDGRTFWVVGNVVATGGGSGNGSGGRQLTYALLDIERRRQAEARMSAAQASLQRVIEAAPLAITLRDARTLRVLQVNQVAAASADSTPEQVVGRTPEEIFQAPIAARRRADMEAALRTHEVTQHEYRVVDRHGAPHLWDTRYVPIASTPGAEPDQLLLVATDVTEQRAAQEARLAAAIAQRETLVREVHHRIKNNLQGVAGLLQQIGVRKPEMAGAITEVVGQVQAIAQVYGLQVGAVGTLRLRSVVEAITESLARNFGCEVQFRAEGDSGPDWKLPEAESIPIALVVNELITNAIKHGVAGVRCVLRSDAAGAQLDIRNTGRLPGGFALERYPSGVSGIGLARALLPRRGAALLIELDGTDVLATLELAAPAIEAL